MGILGAQAAQAQSAQAVDEAGASSDESKDLVVTASRIDRKGFDAPTPATILSAEDLGISNRPNLAEAITDFPQFRIAGSPVTTAASSVVSAASIDLRGLGVPRTLTLLNGRRYLGSTELTSIPQNIVGRVDILTGGASAAWGSGAVAGVVNIFVDDKREGLEVGFDSGISSRGDGGRMTLHANYGRSFAQGRGHFLVAGEYQRDRGIVDRNSGIRPNLDSALFARPDGRLILANDVNFIDATPGGVIRSGALAGQAFNPDGTLSPVQLGTVTNSNSTIGGNSRSLFDYITVSSPFERWNSFGRLSFEFSPAAKIWVEAMYSSIEARRQMQGDSLRASATSGGLLISTDNVFLRPEVRAQLAGGPATFRMGRIIGDAPENGWINGIGKRDTLDLAVGLDGNLGSRWRYSVYYNRGQSWNNDTLRNQRITANFANAVDAVADPLTGNPICRIALTNPTTACRPLNLFGEGNISDEAYAYAFGAGSARIVNKLDAGAATIRGEPFSIWAGDVSVALGVEARRESQSATVDPLSQARALATVNYGPASGAFDVKELFGEAIVPLINMEGKVVLEANGAARYSDYRPGSAIHTLPSARIAERLGVPGSELAQQMRLSPGDPWWKSIDFLNAPAKPRVPALYVSTWYDFGIEDLIAFFAYASDVPDQHLIVSATPHCRMQAATADTVVGNRNVGDPRLDYAELYTNWFRRWLKADDAALKADALPRVQAYEVGSNRWRSGAQWPIEPVKTERLYLSAVQSAASEFGDGRLLASPPAVSRSEAILVDPERPVPSLGGGCCGADVIQDQRKAATRRDVLVYTSEPLSEPLLLSGPIEALLHVSHDRPDGDIFLTVSQVLANGTSHNLGVSALRLRYRDSVSSPARMTPGVVYPVRLTGIVTNTRLGKGDRLRIQITGTNFPNFERNLHHGDVNADQAKPLVGRLTVHEGLEAAPHLLITVGTERRAGGDSGLTSEAVARIEPSNP
jgi:outer membrane receptor protein involved in Fe transport